MSDAVALIAAGGSGERLGADGPKALVECAGRSLLAWSLDAFARSETVGRVVVAGRADQLDRFEEECSDARRDGLDVRVCAGGPSRSHSVREALRAAGIAAGESTDAASTAGLPPAVVLVHDAARPLAGPELVDACARGLLERAGAEALVPAAPVTDTIKQAGPDGAVSATLDRSTLWAVQTPQAFRGDALARVLGLAGVPVADEVIAAATDDASLIESAGGRVVVLPWTQANPKVTTQADLELVAGLLADR